MAPSATTKRLTLAAMLWVAAVPSGCVNQRKSLKPVWGDHDSVAVTAAPGIAASKSLIESSAVDATDPLDQSSQASELVAADRESNDSHSGIPAIAASHATPHCVSQPTSLALALSQAPRDPTVDPAEFQDISLESVLRIAMTSSPAIRSLGGRLLDDPSQAHTQYDQEISASDPFFGPQAALAQFDTVLGSNLTATNYDRVYNNVISGGNAQELVENAAASTASIQKRNMTGALFDVRSFNGYDTNNRIGNLFPSYWETQLEAGVRQPLMRGAGRQFNSIAGPNATPGFNFSQGLVIAQMNNQIAAADFEIALQHFALEVHQAYWALYQSYQSFENNRQTRDLAHRTWQLVTARTGEGIEGGQVDKETLARQKYQRYRRATIASLGGGTNEIGVYEAERRLRHLMGLPLLDSKLLRPSDPLPTAPVNYDWESLVATSMIDRVELRRQAIKVRQQQLKLLASKNFLLPQLDLIGRYRLRGFGDDLTGSGPRFASAYQDFFSFDHQESEFGIEWGMTAGRRQARAAVRNASLQLARERAVLAEQQRELIAKLNESVSRSRSLYNTMQIGREEQTAADERMRANWVLYEIDKVDLFMLLDAREGLLQSSEQFNADSVQYALSTVDVAYQSGRLMHDLGISVIGSELEMEADQVDATLRDSIPHATPPTTAPLPLDDFMPLEQTVPSQMSPDTVPLPAPRPDQNTLVIPPANTTPPATLRLPKPERSNATEAIGTWTESLEPKPSTAWSQSAGATQSATGRIPTLSRIAASPTDDRAKGLNQNANPLVPSEMDLNQALTESASLPGPTKISSVIDKPAVRPARLGGMGTAAVQSSMPARLGSATP